MIVVDDIDAIVRKELRVDTSLCGDISHEEEEEDCSCNSFVLIKSMFNERNDTGLFSRALSLSQGICLSMRSSVQTMTI